MGKIKVAILLIIFFNMISLFSQSNFIVRVEKINSSYYEESYDEGLLTITYDPAPTGTYLSIGATDLSNSNFGMIVTNLFLPGSDEVGNGKQLSVRFNLSGLATLQKSVSLKNNTKSYPTNLELYLHILLAPGFYPFNQSTNKDTITVTVTETTDDAKGSINVTTPEIQIVPVSKKDHTVGDTKSDYRYRGDMPNLDLDSSANGISSSYAGDWNACVPTATSNSIMWLDDKYNEVNLEDGKSHRVVLQELSRLMKRETGEGTYTDKMIAGKLDFAEANKIPIEVKFQAFRLNGNVGSTSGNTLARNLNNKKEDGSNKPPTWDFLKEMIKTGEDVEINYTWYNSAKDKWFAHSVCLSGINEFVSGVKKIAFVHDRRQGTSGGTTEEVYEINVDANGWMRFGADDKNFIKDVVAESPIIEEGRETAAFLNELFVGSNGNVAPGGSFIGNDLIEIVLNETVNDLNNYTISLYDGADGRSYQTYTLDQFTAGSTSNGMVSYYLSLAVGALRTGNAGLAISYSGSVIENQFLSYGGSFVAVDGVAQAMTSSNIGTISSGAGLYLSGSGMKYSDFSWITSTATTPGNPNPNQSFSDVLIAPTSLTAEIGDSSNVVLSWIDNSVQESGFIIERKVNTGSYTVLDSVIQNMTTYSDTDIKNQTIYTYKVKAYNSSSNSDYSNEVEIQVSLTSIKSLNVPTEYFLDQNYPNPFNPSTSIKFGIKNSGNVQLIIFNTLGQKITEIVNNHLEQGIYSAIFYSGDLQSGIYLYQLRTRAFIKTKKMMMIK